eukprot:CAMPEP_0174840446 /NCGR_PEP_ID=MMETSP1114-20130205/8690_1 /TAXON_ID=312471 /ORGANISM="Neobodo designis, Strain CCAP 1951/1" /LENGTH=749 /DNA_ID=CAMNT_0016074593 /DNA_START=24 /DNA_END=2269 /DNA_ORIENTATION=+
MSGNRVKLRGGLQRWSRWFALVVVIAVVSALQNSVALREAIVRRRSVERTGPTHVAVVIPVLPGTNVDAGHSVAAAAGCQTPLTILHVVDSEDAGKRVRDVQRNLVRNVSTSVSFQVVVPITTDSDQTFGHMHEYALSRVAEDPQFTHVLWLSQTHTPVGTAFVDRLVTAIDTPLNGGKVGMATCVTLMPGPRMSVVEKGFDILDGEREGIDRHFVVRRFAGLEHDDPRATGLHQVDAGTAHCTLMRLSVVAEAGVRKEFGLSYDLPDNTKADLELLRSRIVRIGRSLSTISIADVNSGGESLRQSVRAAFHQMKIATLLWEERTGRRYAEAQHDPLAPGVAEDYNALANRVASASLDVQLRFFSEKLAAVVTKLRRPQGADSMDALAWDLSFKFHRRGYRIAATDVAALFSADALPAAVQLRIRNGSDIHRPSYPVYGQLRKLWGRTVASLYPGNDDSEHPFKVVWDGFCCGCCGFASEIAHFVFPMHQKRRIRLTMAPSCFCTGYPAAVTDMLERLHANVFRYAENAPRNEIVVWISHTDPTMYSNPVLVQRKPDYFIGRSMYEFTKVPKQWLQATAGANEIWVPGDWVRNVLVANGVDGRKLYTMPEGIDTHFFDSARRGIIELPFEGHRQKYRRVCNGRGSPSNFKFFSNFKWEPRKGWDVLFDAYGSAFSKDEPVSLYILTFVFARDVSIFNVSFLEDQLTTHLASRGKSLQNLPHFCVVTELLSEVDLGDLYNSADAFVLPTR